jgi:hypothetical protein
VDAKSLSVQKTVCPGVGTGEGADEVVDVGVTLRPVYPAVLGGPFARVCSLDLILLCERDAPLRVLPENLGRGIGGPVTFS